MSITNDQREMLEECSDTACTGCSADRCWSNVPAWDRPLKPGESYTHTPATFDQLAVKARDSLRALVAHAVTEGRVDEMGGCTSALYSLEKLTKDKP